MIVYGAYGYTGRLVVQRALVRGVRPVLAGRQRAPLVEMAERLGLEHRVCDLDDPGGLDQVLWGGGVVAHCAGPFSATAAPMVDACLRTGTHYLDITGEIDVFEAILARGPEAAAAGVVLLPGAGFDVVPSDCLAAMLAGSVDRPVRLDLAVRLGGGASAGTTTTATEGLRPRCRVGGQIVPVPRDRRRRRARFATGDAAVTAVSWGDVSTAYHSTGIPDITTYAPVPGAVAAAGEAAAALLERPAVRRAVQRLTRRLPGPSASKRRRTTGEVWGEVTGAGGDTASGTVSTPNGYDFTADSVVEIARRVDDLVPGAHTPSGALGAELVRSLDGVTVSVHVPAH